MQTTNISMPNPVLGIPGDMSGAFSVLFKLAINRTTRTYRIFNFDESITNLYIKNLFERGDVNLVLKVSCIPTYKTWTFINPDEILIAENEVDSLLEIDCYLITSSEMKCYKDISFSDLFDNKEFVLEKGDIVAFTGTKKIPIEKENEKVSISSIFRFSKIELFAENQNLHFDFDDDEIVIYYPSTNSEYDPITFLFDQVQGLPYTALSLYIIPALTDAFRLMQSEEVLKFSDKRWSIVLESILPKNDWDEEPFVNAQNVIDNVPIILAFDEILKSKKNKA